MKQFIFAIILRFFATNLDSIIASLTKLDTQLDKFIARQGDVYAAERANATAAMERANSAADDKNRAERIRSRVRALTA